MVPSVLFGKTPTQWCQWCSKVKSLEVREKPLTSVTFALWAPDVAFLNQEFVDESILELLHLCRLHIIRARALSGYFLSYDDAYLRAWTYSKNSQNFAQMAKNYIFSVSNTFWDSSHQKAHLICQIQTVLTFSSNTIVASQKQRWWKYRLKSWWIRVFDPRGGSLHRQETLAFFWQWLQSLSHNNHSVSCLIPNKSQRHRWKIGKHSSLLKQIKCFQRHK